MVEYMNGITYFEAPNTLQAPSSLNEQYACIQSLKGWKVVDGMGALVFGLQSGAENRVAKCVRICDKSQSRCSSWTHAPCRCTPLVVVVVARNWVKWVAQNTAQRNATENWVSAASTATTTTTTTSEVNERRRSQLQVHCRGRWNVTSVQPRPDQTSPAQCGRAQSGTERSGSGWGCAASLPVGDGGGGLWQHLDQVSHDIIPFDSMRRHWELKIARRL